LLSLLPQQKPKRRNLSSVKKKNYKLTDLPKSNTQNKRITTDLQVQIDDKGHTNKDQIVDKVAGPQKKIIAEVLD